MLSSFSPVDLFLVALYLFAVDLFVFTSNFVTDTDLCLYQCSPAPHIDLVPSVQCNFPVSATFLILCVKNIAEPEFILYSVDVVYLSFNSCFFSAVVLAWVYVVIIVNVDVVINNRKLIFVNFLNFLFFFDNITNNITNIAANITPMLAPIIAPVFTDTITVASE